MHEKQLLTEKEINILFDILAEQPFYSFPNEYEDPFKFNGDTVDVYLNISASSNSNN